MKAFKKKTIEVHYFYDSVGEQYTTNVYYQDIISALNHYELAFYLHTDGYEKYEVSRSFTLDKESEAVVVSFSSGTLTHEQSSLISFEESESGGSGGGGGVPIYFTGENIYSTTETELYDSQVIIKYAFSNELVTDDYETILNKILNGTYIPYVYADVLIPLSFARPNEEYTFFTLPVSLANRLDQFVSADGDYEYYWQTYGYSVNINYWSEEDGGDNQWHIFLNNCDATINNIGLIVQLYTA